MWLIVYSNDHAPLTVRPICSSSELRTAQMMIFSLVAMIGLEKCCITSVCLQWLCHSGERTVARGPLVLILCFSVLLVLRLPRLGKRELILVLFVRLFGLCLFRFVGFLFLLGSGKGCGSPWTFLFPFLYYKLIFTESRSGSKIL